MKFVEVIHKMFSRNFYGWFHQWGGGALFVLAAPFWGNDIAFVFVLGIAILWDVGEWTVGYFDLRKTLDNPLDAWAVKTYGSVSRALLDSIGDVILAVSSAALIWLGRTHYLDYLVFKFSNELCVAIGWNC